jgi:hypothetical protein
MMQQDQLKLVEGDDRHFETISYELPLLIISTDERMPLHELAYSRPAWLLLLAT